MTFLAAAAVIGGTTLLGSAISANASQKAANQYSNVANQGILYNREMFNTVSGQNQPYRMLGEQSSNVYANLLNSGYLTAQPTMNDLTSLMPNYRFGLEQGLGQFNAGLNAGGGAISGNAIQGANQFTQDYAGNQLMNAFNAYQANRSNVASNVGAGIGYGLNANQITSNAASGAASNTSNLLSSIGNAQAQGTMGAANAITSGLNNISNYAMLYGLKKMG